MGAVVRLPADLVEIFDAWRDGKEGSIEAAGRAWNAADRATREAIDAEWGYPRTPWLDGSNEVLAKIIRMNMDPLREARWRPYMKVGPDGCLRRSGLGYYVCAEPGCTLAEHSASVPHQPTLSA